MSCDIQSEQARVSCEAQSTTCRRLLDTPLLFAVLRKITDGGRTADQARALCLAPADPAVNCLCLRACLVLLWIFLFFVHSGL